MTTATNYEEKSILGQARGMSILYMNVCLSHLYKYFNSWLQSLLLLLFFSPSHMDLNFSFIFKHKSS